jgi:hypothetical protein
MGDRVGAGGSGHVEHFVKPGPVSRRPSSLTAFHLDR